METAKNFCQKLLLDTHASSASTWGRPWLVLKTQKPNTTNQGRQKLFTLTPKNLQNAKPESEQNGRE